jgi:hypothetical protein
MVEVSVENLVFDLILDELIVFNGFQISVDGLPRLEKCFIFLVFLGLS